MHLDLEGFSDFELDNFSTDTESDLPLDSLSQDGKESEDSDFEDNPMDLLELYFIMYNTRYFVKRHVSLKSKEFAKQFFHCLADPLFRQLTRMDKPSFYHLLDLIRQHPVFQTQSNYEQAPVEAQLAVCLDRLGHDSNGACLNHMIPTWGVSCGSIVNYSKRCFVALESVLSEYIQWPTRAEQEFDSQAFGRMGFPGCIGLIDGSLCPLSQRPA